MARRPKANDNDDEPRGRKKLDPIIEGLFARLPPSGTEWPESERKTWLDLITAAFRVVYELPSPPGTP